MHSVCACPGQVYFGGYMQGKNFINEVSIAVMCSFRCIVSQRDNCYEYIWQRFTGNSRDAISTLTISLFPTPIPPPPPPPPPPPLLSLSLSFLFFLFLQTRHYHLFHHYSGGQCCYYCFMCSLLACRLAGTDCKNR